MKRVLQWSCWLLLGLPMAHGQQLIYRPVNPSFGGNTFNYAWMLSSAQAQDKLKDPSIQRTTTSTNTSQNTLNSFAESLQRQLLSRITNNLVNQQFGEEDIKEGTYRFGDFQVDITNGTDGIIIRITDGRGGETTVTVPYF
ncbi:curli production assembly protein CsgF [Fibrisoma montanum]|uniref:Curli production assembly/transport component CsgF n=1 Tax=Fibrisoma montanum TaxID=2305895 RepID=A0A418MHI6_9BACT|nr:curli production assembly/transport component CsgF [Fibrisoma montanum]RIV26898.1 curli production assembly protein CsgF [Fibrisoma montanum]